MIQEVLLPLLVPFIGAIIIPLLGILFRKVGLERARDLIATSVSYTHLTLPTKRIV